MEIVIVDGQYFAYSNGHNYASPKSQEHLIIDEIPLDPVQYKEWLKNEREAHSNLKAQLDVHTYTISDASKARLAEFTDLWEPYADRPSASLRGTMVWSVSHRGPHGFLERLPYALFNKGTDLLIREMATRVNDTSFSDAHEVDTNMGITHEASSLSWLTKNYTIDLDRETFSVNNHTFYNLWDFLRHRKAEHESMEPQPLPPKVDLENYFGDSLGDRDKYQAVYHQYNHSVVSATAAPSNPSIQQAMSMMFFEKFADPYATRFWEYAPRWRHDGFAFREFAFAILSIAAGRFYFLERANYNRFAGYDVEGYIIDRNNGKPLSVPIFGMECHEPGVSPGSAPNETLYWFENIVVSLVPDSILRQDTEAAIAKAVEYGFREGKTSFQTILFSIFDVILLEAYVKDGIKVVRRTEVISIQDRDRKSDWTFDPDKLVFRREADVATTFKQVCHKHMGFAKLQTFFDVAARRKLPRHTKDRLPVELYANIMSYLDPRTLHAISQVSWSLRRLYYKRFAFSDDLDTVQFDASLKGPPFPGPPKYELSEEEILEIEMEEQAEPKGQPELCLNDLGTFTFRNRMSGLITKSGMDVKQKIDYELRVLTAHEDYSRIWMPVIGGTLRPSLISQIMFHLNFKSTRLVHRW
ncbi:hypothetical protein V494_06273 [Pseudogymnoascus sp. VKM F-4513 (FW-928)]|nr:hypothetical protein V494_06273 [Pseudogymnoascus sp. VKM F-4513 (FW-928)]